MNIALSILAGFVLLVTVLPILKHEAWWIRILDFPRVQIIVGGAVVLAGIIVWRPDPVLLHQGLGSALSLALAYHVYRILPFSRLWRKQVPGADVRDSRGDTVSLLVANVLMENRNSAALFEIVDSCDPDLILTVETDEWWARQMTRYDSSHPHGLSQAKSDTYGMVFKSRFLLEHVSLRHLVEPDVPSVFARVVLPSGRRVTFFGLHPRPPHPQHAPDTSPRDAELLIVGKESANIDGPVIVAGDLNDVAWSHTTRLFQRVSGLLDPRRGRGMFNTFHAGLWFARWPLDHVFHSRHFRLLVLERLPAFGSDHFPMYARLAFNPIGSSRDLPEAADESDLEELRQKITDSTMKA
jgi:endonuclease/exonuclease/phosphatase (EEP) superfamily protein YafD